MGRILTILALLITSIMAIGAIFGAINTMCFAVVMGVVGGFFPAGRAAGGELSSVAISVFLALAGKPSIAALERLLGMVQSLAVPPVPCYPKEEGFPDPF